MLTSVIAEDAILLFLVKLIPALHVQIITYMKCVPICPDILLSHPTPLSIIPILLCSILVIHMESGFNVMRVEILTSGIASITVARTVSLSSTSNAWPLNIKM